MNHPLNWKKFHPLSDKNAFICLVDHMGDDSSTVQAARVSYGKDEQEEELLDKYFLEGAKKVFGPDAVAVNVSNGNMSVFMEEQGEYPEILFEGPIECGDAQTVINYCHEKVNKHKTKDRQLIRYLMNHQHTTPFEMVEFKFMVQVPMDCWRQWIRHRTANVNEYSTRYTEALDFFQVTAPTEWRLQATNNKQGSSGFLEEWPEGIEFTHNENRREIAITHNDKLYVFPYPDPPENITPGELLSHLEKDQNFEQQQLYQLRLAFGIAKEQARKDLPLSTYTRAYWKCDLHNIFNFLRLRMDSHAQLEIRSFANSMYEIVKEVCPVACEAFKDYVLYAKKFSRMEMEVLTTLLAKGVEKTQVMQEFSYDDTMTKDEANTEWLGRLHQALAETTSKPDNMTDREWTEFLNKLK